MSRITRKKGRLRSPTYDYTSPGIYFVTICCYRKECHFGRILRSQMILNDFGKLVHDYWLLLPFFFPKIKLHNFQIMPNHVHALLEIRSHVVKSLPNLDRLVSQPDLYLLPEKTEFPVTKTLSEIIGAYKSLVANQCLVLHKLKYTNTDHIPYLGKIWMRSFHEIIVTNKNAYRAIDRYITNNPKKWNRQ